MIRSVVRPIVVRPILEDSLVLVHNDAEMNSLLKQSTVLFFCLCTSGTVVFRRTTLPKVSISSISSRTRPSTSSSTRFVPTSPFILEIRCHEDLADHASPHPAALRHSSGKRGGPAVLSSLRRRGAADDDVDSSAHLAAAPGGRDFTENST